MTIIVVDCNDEAVGFDGLYGGHSVDRFDILACPLPTNKLHTADAVVVSPTASRAIRGGQSGELRQFRDQCIALFRRGGVVINLCEGEPSGIRPGKFVAYPLVGSEPVHLLDHRPEGIESANPGRLIRAVTAYTDRQARFTMVTPALERYIPVGGRRKPPALRTPIWNGSGTELLLPLTRPTLTVADAANLASIAAYFHDAACEGAAWQHRLRLMRDDCDCGLIAYDEYECVIDDPGDCFHVIVDVHGLKVRSCRPAGRLALVQLKRGEMLAVLDLFMHRGVSHRPMQCETRFFHPDGRRFRFSSPESRTRQRDKAIQKINGLGELITKSLGCLEVSKCVPSSVRGVGIVIPDYCLRPRPVANEAHATCR